MTKQLRSAGSTHVNSSTRGRRGLFAGLAALGLVAATATSAAAVPGDTSSDTVVANVDVTTAIVLSGLTPSFALDGVPGATVAGEREVTMAVTTNNLAGYSVTVQAATPTLVATTAGNTDSIPIGNLHIREHAANDAGNATPFTSLSSGTSVLVHTQATRSALAGDALVNDFSVNIPFVNEDTYSATLNYIATTL